MSIYIFSGPIHSGKTTHILKWCRRQESVSGILMPDIDGRRKIIDLDTMDVFDIECADTANTKEALTSVGSYNFFNAVFEKANAICSLISGRCAAAYVFPAKKILKLPCDIERKGSVSWFRILFVKAARWG